ncbi:snRNA-activating protein complex subunit 4 isoform X2 [Electrophorus electricus]|nr:snRNA-activating protein complex subunit 4 isoform X2 [Electrophorus electricus]
MTAPEDILAQRNKIQRQILALESTLGADSSVVDLLSSDSDSDSLSEDSNSGRVGEKVAQDALEAERQQILQEIKELEQTLGPNAALVDALTDSEHGTGSKLVSSDEDSDDEELCLPQDMETCLQMNLVYQEVLKEKLADLERLLNENRQQQEEIETQLSGPSSTSRQPHLKLFLGTFMKPYFKDKLTGLGPPANEETRERCSYGKMPCDEMRIRRWNGWQKTLLIDTVVKDTMKRMQQPKMSKVEYLTGKLSKAEDKEKEELKRQIVLLEKEIKEISSMKEDQLYGSRWDDHDWEKISNIDFEGHRHPEDLMRFWQNYLHPSINKSSWNQDEIEKLSSTVVQYKYCHWDQISEALGTNRSAFMCFQTYQRYISKSFRKRFWTKEEDQILRDLVEKMRIGNFIPYTQMSYFMEGRDHSQIMYRWTAVLDPSIKKGPWSKEEDQLLLKAVEKFGCKDWCKIRLEVPGRTDNACRDRYLDCLRADVKRGTWSAEEVELLKKMVEKYGVGKWSKIASEIPNRIDSQCLNKWRGMMQLATKKGTKRVRKKTPMSLNQGSWPKRRKVIEEEEGAEEEVKSDSNSEDEKVKLEYMDSDGEQAGGNKLDVPSEEEMDHKEEYIQPDIKEWIPAGGFVHPAGTVKTMLVRLPTEEDERDWGRRTGQSVGNSPLTPPCQSKPVRSTVLDHLGNPVKTYVGIEPPALPMWDSCNENAMDKVPVSDVRYLLIWSSNRHHMKAIMRKNKKNPSSAKEQKHAQSYEQETKRVRRHLSRDTTNTPNTQTSLNYALMIAVLPWVGNVMMPLLFSRKKVCEADIVRKRAAVVHLQKTSVFLLFLKALHIDAEGCKKVIEARKALVSRTSSVKCTQSRRHQPEPITNSKPQTAMQYNPRSSCATMTVAKLLAKKNLQTSSPKPPETEQTPAPPQPTKLPIPRNKPRRKPQQVLQSATQIMRPTLVVPFISQSKTHQGVGTPEPVRQEILPLLQSQGAFEVCQPVLQLVVPVEPWKMAQPEVPLTTLTLRPSSTASPTKSLGEVKTPKTAIPTTSTSSPSTTVPPTKSSGEVKTPKTAPPTTSTSSPSTTLPPTKSSGELKTPKRICRPTMKAQELIENAKIKASEKQKVKKRHGHDDAPTAVLPQTTAWILTPTGLMPLAGIHLTSSGTLGNQNPVMPNIVPQVLFEPPVIVNQNSSFAFVNAVQPSNTTTVSPALVLPGTNVTPPTAKPNLDQSPCLSTASNQHNVSSLLSVNKDSNISTTITNTYSVSGVTNASSVPTILSSPAVQSKVSCSQNQSILSLVPQMTIQSPIIVNQNSSLTLLCDAVRPTVPLNSSVAPKPVASNPVGISQKSMPTSGVNTTKASSLTSVNNVLSFSSASAVTHAPAVRPVSPSFLTLSSPVIQMPSPTFPGNQNQRMPYPQIVSQQPAITKQNGSTALINIAESSITVNGSPAPITNVSPSPSAPSRDPSASAAEISKVSSASSVTNELVSPDSATKTHCVPSGPSSVLNVFTSVVSSEMSAAAPQKNSVHQGPVSIQHRLPVEVRCLPKGQLDANKTAGYTDPSCQILHKTKAPQAKKKPLQPAAAMSKPGPKPDSLPFDPNLMFLEHPGQVKDWIKGNDGISLPYLEEKMPYLPPFVSNINTLACLLKAKQSLLKTAVQLLPEEDQDGSGEEEKVAAVRKLVSEKFKTNPAYLLLKARFLSCFTLPALLATIHPCKESQDSYDNEDDTNDQVMLQIAGSLLSKNECEASEAQFSGIRERMQNDHHTVQR